MDFKAAQQLLLSADVCIESGLNAEEIARIEQTFAFRFPPDLREFLSTGLPVSSPWVNWRHDPASSIRDRLEWPLHGLCFDIEHADFWMPEWGDKPATLRDKFDIARRAVSEAPVLIPIFSHRYIPASPPESGNPMLSVHQTDIIYYGADLADYLQNEFLQAFGRDEWRLPDRVKTIPFWTRLIEFSSEPQPRKK
jgi:hypothetical protein